ncbi:hypothetical protein [Microbacterium sp. Kw_RZR3]|uniref:hypothetical protein n=1 Tax=unclassified Microbacterium TaxID=2609290 RepID=UPI0023DB9C49|nr:hypothetical protein [Microbacterium sp. Kw_RZR3]MDF2046599.1 hypothetical protein [Microbacterium sp. Kw_RZR3]MDF2920869.1 hypothetical protein [Microbacterium sp.]
MSIVTEHNTEGKWWLSLLYIPVILVASVSGIFSLGIAPFVSWSDASPVDIARMLCVVVAAGGAPLLTVICLRVRAVRSRLRPGAVSIAASGATILAVGWTVIVVVGYQESAGDVWRTLPFFLGVCAPVLIVAICALTISRVIQRDDAHRVAAVRGAALAP